MDRTSPKSPFRTKANHSTSSRTLLVTKDEDGYGLTLSGDNPVFVQTVKPGGAADRAGVQRGDIIVRVNGQAATKMYHTEVVQLIQAAPSVKVTVMQANQPPYPDSEMGMSPGTLEASSSSSLLKHSRSSLSPGRSPALPTCFATSFPLQDGLKTLQTLERMERITSPQPANTEAARALKNEGEHTLQLMVEKARQDVDQLRQSLAKSSDTTLQREIESKMKILNNLEDRVRHSKITQYSLTPSEDVPVLPPRPDLLPLSSSLSKNSVPPPLPARNRHSAEIFRESGINPESPPPLPPPRQSVPLPPPPVLDKKNLLQSPTIFQRSDKAMGPSPKHERTRSSPSSSSEMWDGLERISPRYETPPGTPPPPYFGTEHELLSGSGLVTWDDLTSVENTVIINMEDEDEEDVSEAEIGIGALRVSSVNPEVASVHVHKTPYDDLRELQSHHAHLAVFINFVLSSNLNPSSMFFYLITEDYKLGQVKEMQRWAYEIHSSFLVPNAPLALPNIEHSIVYEIDRDLQEAFDCETRLRKLFWKARSTARKSLKDQLSEFRDKRTAGLGGMFGPPDFELQQCIVNKTKELQVIEELLLPILEPLLEKLDSATDRCLAVLSSLATIMSKVFKLRSPTALSFLERCPTYVSKEKKSSRMFPRAKKSTLVNGHHFEPTQYNHVTYCNQSQQRIWGISPQGFRCAYCNFDVQKKFVNRVDESCVGPAKKTRLLTKLADIQVTNKKQTSMNSGQRETSGFHILDDQGDEHSNVSQSDIRNYSGTGDLPELQASVDSFSGKSLLANNLSKSQASQSSSYQSERLPLRTQSSASLVDKPTKSISKVDRSQSCKIDKNDATRNISRDRRKHSDPSIPTSIASDTDPELHAINITNQTFGSSSTSSLSARSPLDSPAGSTQEVTQGHFRSGGVHPNSSSSFSTTPVTSTLASSDSSYFQQIYEDSDFETEVDPPDWRLSLSPEDLGNLKPKEKKRQDVINEFFHTERSHVRNLKVLDRLFFRPLRDSMTMSGELTERLFPNLEEVLTVHLSFSQKMKERIKGGYPIGKIGDILSDMFEGSNGDCLIRVGSEFTKNQKLSIEELKDRRRKDHKLESFLADQEKRPECRRLQLQSILPVEHQRLVKYPLLLEQLLKQCDEEFDKNEFNIIKKCVERTREILASIDRQVAEAQNIHRLAEIQQNLDTSALEKVNDNSLAEYKNLDLTRYRLIYDGPMTLKLGDTRRMKTVELHVLLLENCLMLLQKQDEKYVLKFHTFPGGNAGGQGGSGKLCHSPILTIDNILIRTVATDKKALYLINTTGKGPQIYELIAASSADRAQWFRHISEATEAYKHVIKNNSAKDSDFRNEVVNKTMQSPKLTNYEHSFSEFDPHPERQPSHLDEKHDADTFGARAGANESVEEHRKRLECIEIQKIAEASPFIDPSEVLVTHGEVLIADPVLTPLERLRRKDLEVTKALEEKQRLIAEILHIPLHNFELIADIASQPLPNKDAKEVLLAALDQAKSLSDLVNSTLTLCERDTVAATSEPTKGASNDLENSCLRMQAEKLMGISSNMNLHLTSLLAIIQAGDSEKEQLRKELQQSRDQVDALMLQHSNENAIMGSEFYPVSRLNIPRVGDVSATNVEQGEYENKFPDGGDQTREELVVDQENVPIYEDLLPTNMEEFVDDPDKEISFAGTS